MEAKLIKSDVQYRLHNEEGIVIATSTDGKLSLKNCQEIERGYDLDELAEDWCMKSENNWSNNNNEVGDNYGSYKEGFQKAIEILGDKKFSGGDMEEAFADGQLNQLHNQKYFSGSKAYIQSLQQTEWDVEIVMEYVGKIKLNKLHEMKPKLDADGCLILKRK